MKAVFYSKYGDPGVPVQLNVQMSPDGVVREVVIIDESDTQRSVAGFGSGGIGVGMGFGF